MSSLQSSPRKTLSDGRLGQVLSALRQLRFPKEFRIGPAVWPQNLASLIEQLIRPGPTPPATASIPEEAEEAEEAGGLGTVESQMRLLVDVGTNLWRLRGKMIEPGTDQPLAEMQRAHRHFGGIWDALADAGLDIREHAGEPFPERGIYGLKALVYQPTPGISRETVIETVKPTIYFQDQMIQMGEVIVGTPKPPVGEAPDVCTGAEHPTNQRLRASPKKGDKIHDQDND